MQTDHLSETRNNAGLPQDHAPEEFFYSPSYGGRTVTYRLLSPPDSEETESALKARLLEDCEYDSRLGINYLAEMYTNSDAEGTPRISGVSEEHERNSVASVDSDPRKGFTERQRGEDTGYVRVEVNGDGEIDLFVSPMRPKTHLGKKQGRHITAYALFVYAILTSVDEQSIQDIPDLLVNIAQNFVPEAFWVDLQSLLTEFKGNKKNTPLSRKDRKLALAAIRTVMGSEECVQKTKAAYAVAESLPIANLVRAISEEILKGINQSVDVVYAPLTKKSASELGREGVRVRRALSELHALHKAILYAKNNANIDPEDLKAQASEATASAWIPAFDAMGLICEIEETRIAKIARCLADLFDLEYHEYRASMFFNEMSKDQKTKFEQQFKSNAQHEHPDPKKILEKFLDEDQEMSQKVAQIEEVINDKLHSIVSQHIRVVFYHAFFGLNFIKQKEDIFAQFLKILHSSEYRWPEIIGKRLLKLFMSMEPNMSSAGNLSKIWLSSSMHLFAGSSEGQDPEGLLPLAPSI